MADVEIGALHQRDAQQLGQIPVLEKGRAELAVGEQHTNRRGGAAEGGEHIEVSGLDIVRNDVVTAGQFGQHLQTDLGGLQLVGDAGRDAQVVFKDDITTVTHVDQIDAVDMHKQVAVRAKVLQPRVVILARVHNVRWDDLLVAAVEIEKEMVDRFQSLGNAPGDRVPFVGRDQPGQPIGGYGAELARVQHKGERVQRGAIVGVAPTLPQFRHAEAVQAVHQWLVDGTGRPVGVQVFVQRVFRDVASQHVPPNP